MQRIPTEGAAPWQLRESARPLLAWSAAQLDALADALAISLGEWRQAWGLGLQEEPVRCAPANSADALRGGWRTLGGSAACAWLHESPEGASAIGEMLFGGRPGSASAAGEVAQACAMDVRRRMAQALRLSNESSAPSTPPPGTGLAWSGAVHASLPGTPGWSVLVSGAAMQAWCGWSGLSARSTREHAAREPLCSAAEAMGASPVSLKVELSGCAIDLGTLQDLRLGDVVLLEHSLEAPARLTGLGGGLLFEGALVARDGLKAIELVARSTR